MELLSPVSLVPLVIDKVDLRAKNLGSKQNELLWTKCVKFLTKNTHASQILEAVTHATLWIKNISSTACTSLSQATNDAKKEGKFFKDIVGFSEAPEKLSSLLSSFNQCKKSPSLNSAKTLLSNAVSLTRSVCNGLSVADRFIPLKNESLMIVNGVVIVSNLYTNGNQTLKDLENLSSSKLLEVQSIEDSVREKKKVVFNLINLAKSISYFVLALLTCLSFFLGFELISWVFLSCLAWGILFKVGGYFYEKIIQPNKMILIENPLSPSAIVP